MKIKLEKNHSFIDIILPDEKILDILIGRTVPAIGHDRAREIIAQGIRNHCPQDIRNKSIAVIIPDHTRLWARGDIFVPEIVRTLLSMGVPSKKIRIIIATGTHEDMPEESFSALAGTFCAQSIEILNAANRNQDRLVDLGRTHKNTPLFITREAVEADHIIIFGGLLHHLIAGFGGGRKYILPGIAGYDSIQKNHSLAFRKDGTPHPLARQAKLWGNPVNEDLNDAALMFLDGKTCTYAAVAVNGTGDIFHADAGPLHETFMKGCEALNGACCIQVPGKGDFALISAGGHRSDGQLYQSTKALFNAVNVVKPGGDILFVAGCAQGVGNDTFARAMKDFKTNPAHLGRKLAAEFDMPAYVAFRTLDALTRFTITLVSDFSERETRDLGFHFAEDLESYVHELKGKGYIIPFAENILPLAEQLVSRPMETRT